MIISDGTISDGLSHRKKKYLLNLLAIIENVLAIAIIVTNNH